MFKGGRGMLLFNFDSLTFTISVPEGGGKNKEFRRTSQKVSAKKERNLKKSLKGKSQHRVIRLTRKKADCWWAVYLSGGG